MTRLNTALRPLTPTWLLLLLFTVLAAGGCGSGDERGEPVEGVPSTLPYPALATDCLATGWWPVTPIRRYFGDARYDYFLRDAELYREYGLDRVEVQDYVNVEGDAVRVEVFQTETPTGAYGLFSLKTQPGGEIVDVGVDAWLEREVLNFWRGRHQVTIRAQEVRGPRVRRLDHLGFSVNQGLRGGVARPPLMKRLPRRGLLPKGRVYLAGPASLERVVGQDGWRFPAPIRGVQGSYSGVGGDHSLLILEYASPEAALAAGVAAAPEGSDLNPARTRLLVVLPLEKDRYLLAYIGPKDPDRAKTALADAVQEFVRKDE